MPLKIIITGLPRTGTTVLFKIVQDALAELDSSWVFIYEPLSPHIMEKPEEHFPHDYLEYSYRTDLPRLTQLHCVLKKYSDWYYRDDVEYAHKVTCEVVDAINSLDKPVLVKDLYLMMFLDEVLDRVDARVVFTVRDFESWARAVLTWTTFWKRFRRALAKIRSLGIRAVTRLHRMPSVVKYLASRLYLGPPYFGAVRPYAAAIGRAQELQQRGLTRELLWEIWNYAQLQLQRAQARHPGRVLVVTLSALQKYPREVLRQVGMYLGLPNLEKYASLVREV